MLLNPAYFQCCHGHSLWQDYQFYLVKDIELFGGLAITAVTTKEDENEQ